MEEDPSVFEDGRREEIIDELEAIKEECLGHTNQMINSIKDSTVRIFGEHEEAPALVLTKEEQEFKDEFQKAILNLSRLLGRFGVSRMTQSLIASSIMELNTELLIAFVGDNYLNYMIKLPDIMRLLLFDPEDAVISMVMANLMLTFLLHTYCGSWFQHYGVNWGVLDEKSEHDIEEAYTNEKKMFALYVGMPPEMYASSFKFTEQWVLFTNYILPYWLVRILSQIHYPESLVVPLYQVWTTYHASLNSARTLYKKALKRVEIISDAGEAFQRVVCPNYHLECSPLVSSFIYDHGRIPISELEQNEAGNASILITKVVKEDGEDVISVASGLHLCLYNAFIEWAIDRISLNCRIARWNFDAQMSEFFGKHTMEEITTVEKVMNEFVELVTIFNAALLSNKVDLIKWSSCMGLDDETWNVFCRNSIDDFLPSYGFEDVIYGHKANYFYNKQLDNARKSALGMDFEKPDMPTSKFIQEFTLNPDEFVHRNHNAPALDSVIIMANMLRNDEMVKEEWAEKLKEMFENFGHSFRSPHGKDTPFLENMIASQKAVLYSEKLAVMYKETDDTTQRIKRELGVEDTLDDVSAKRTELEE